MTKARIYKTLIALPLLFVIVSAQTGTDAIEKARQAKEAAEKAAAEAAAATEAAIEQAAQKAAAEARSDAKRKKEEEEARKLAEKKAAEEAELDAAAAKAAEEAKRKMAAELGLEYDDGKKNEVSKAKSSSSTEEASEETLAEEVVAKESSGYNLGFSGSFGFIQGDFFDNIPTGGSLVISTPWGFDLGGLRFGLSATVGAYPAKHSGSGESFTPMAIGLGGNLTLAEVLFVEGHVGNVGNATGARGFAGISLERIMKNVKLPVNLLVGAEGFLSTQVAEWEGSGTYWGGLAFRVDYNL